MTAESSQQKAMVREIVKELHLTPRGVHPNPFDRTMQLHIVDAQDADMMLAFGA
jgi:hypothetical protein